MYKFRNMTLPYRIRSVVLSIAILFSDVRVRRGDEKGVGSTTGNDRMFSFFIFTYSFSILDADEIVECSFVVIDEDNGSEGYQ